MRSEIKERIKQIRLGEVPVGYKRTKLGVIPEEWSVLKIKDISVDIVAGATPKTDVLEYWNGNIPWMSSGEINKRFIHSTEKFITQKGYENTSTKLLPKNSVLVALAGQGKTRGKVAINKIELCTNQSLAAIIPNKLVNYEFLFHYLDNKYLELRRLSAGDGGRGGLNLSIISNINISLPDLNEQQEIAQVLTVWDRFIDLKERLIGQKKLRKKGLMQLLLTGKMRLPGYTSDWEQVRLGDLLKERKEIGYSHLELLAITSGKGVVRRSEVDIKDTSSEDKSKYKRILPGDIGYNTMRMWQGVSGVSKYEGIVSPAYTILKPTDKVDAGFIGYLFKLPLIINLFRRYSQGLVDDNLNLKYENFKVIKVKIPRDINEQKAIAEILRCADTEIHLLEKEIKYLKQQKKGLMQLLLTGMVRVHELERVNAENSLVP
ncbi:restriction endonuclease subunit S [Thermoactinomyces sp. CICC 10521]|uniref:restriction endonuclease subunit S n=1 Tax=Thermoactinomyces sp. CICC 10521 TaxID=2767426 RepID=UPI0018DC2085|nr:restriction endonuclease subunit S [Thermoactinomyces sp. CICC 10521]MBH8608028.1 restriction endonuclease subunit S [Thermoactinomyces sp. CICC 10521]